MREPATDENEASPERNGKLPPMFGPIENGKRTWIRVGAIDYELMGYLLSCHLIIEHYMDAFLKAHHADLEWDGARLTFGQRVALLSMWRIGEPFNPVKEIKHLNSLRNRLGHRVDYRLTSEDMLPLIHYLQRVADHSEQPPVRELVDEPPKVILEMFTTITAAVFAGSVSRTVRTTDGTRRATSIDACGKQDACE